MSLILRHSLPRMIQRGVAETLTADVYDNAGTQQTATAATLSLYAGSRLILDGVTATAGAPSSYTMVTADTSSESLSDTWLEVWSLTAGGVVYTFRRDAMLVRHLLYPVITDTDLVALHSDIAELRDSDQSDYGTQRLAAWERIQRKLIARGRRPWLVMASWALKDVHTWETLELVFTDLASSVGDGRYLALADRYRALADSWWNSEGNFRYDEDEDGYQDTSETSSADPVIFLNRAPEW